MSPVFIISTLVIIMLNIDQLVETHFQAILTVGISFHKLVFTVKTLVATPLWVSLVMFLYAIATANGL